MARVTDRVCRARAAYEFHCPLGFKVLGFWGFGVLGF